MARPCPQPTGMAPGAPRPPGATPRKNRAVRSGPSGPSCLAPGGSLGTDGEKKRQPRQGAPWAKVPLTGLARSCQSAFPMLPHGAKKDGPGGPRFPAPFSGAERCDRWPRPKRENGPPRTEPPIRAARSRLVGTALQSTMDADQHEGVNWCMEFTHMRYSYHYCPAPLSPAGTSPGARHGSSALAAWAPSAALALSRLIVPPGPAEPIRHWPLVIGHSFVIRHSESVTCGPPAIRLQR